MDASVQREHTQGAGTPRGARWSLPAAPGRTVWSRLGWALILALIACCLPPGAARAASSPMAAFDAAAKAYESGEFEAAARAFETLAADGVVSPTVWFNAGNAWLKAAHPGHAIVAYRRALKLSPRDTEIRRNLGMARSRVQGASGPEAGRPASEWLSQLTTREWAVLACTFSWILVGLLAWRGRTRSDAAEAWSAPAALVAGLGLALAAAGWATGASASDASHAVVVVPETAVRFGPLEESPVAFRLPDGAEVRIRSEKAEWSMVRVDASREGWMRTRDLRRVFSADPSSIPAGKAARARQGG